MKKLFTFPRRCFLLLFLGIGYAAMAQPQRLPVTPDMLSGSQTFMQSEAALGYADPIPYGVANNADDQGWIWLNESVLEADFGRPIALTELRVWSVYSLEPRGGNWAIECSDDHAAWTQAAECLFATRPGGGTNDDGSVRDDCAGWYEIAFNANRNSHRYWRIRQTGVAGFPHSPRSSQIQFYGFTGHIASPFVRAVSPSGKLIRSKTPLQIQLQDGLSEVDPASVRLYLNRQLMASSVSKPAGTNVTLVRYAPAAWPLGTSAVRLVYADKATPAKLQTNDYSYVVVSDREWAGHAAARAKLEARPIPRTSGLQGIVEIGVEPKSISTLPAELEEIRLALTAERNDFQGGARERIAFPELVLDRKSTFKTSFIPSRDLKPGFYKVTGRNPMRSEGTPAPGSECVFAFIVPPPNVPSEQVHGVVEGSPGQDARSAHVLSLDGPWQLAIDPSNIGRKEEWFKRGPVEGARLARVPSVVDEVFPGGYEGAMWYWKESKVDALSAGERILLRFGAVDYLAEIWVNGIQTAEHEGGDTPFTTDITQAVGKGGQVRLVVRVLSPGNQAVDGLSKREIPQGYKNYGLAQWHWNPGGLWQSVDLLRVPSVRVSDIFTDARWRDGIIGCDTTLVNESGQTQKTTLRYEVAPAGGGSIASTELREVDLPVGTSVVKTELGVPNARSWSLDDPYLYRVTVRAASPVGEHDEAVRCGFREFAFRDGYFRLNGKRLWIKSCHNSQHYPIGQHIPTDMGMLRREMINLKAMGFNTVRIPWRAMHPLQLALCDELGFLVYQEHYGSWLMDYSPRHNERFDRSVCETVLRDRNHPALVMRGLLNETPDGPRFRHAVDTLPLVRALDPNRLIILSSGRWDPNLSVGSLSNPGSSGWDCLLGGEEAAEKSASPTIGKRPGAPGDIHHYCARPTPAESVTLLRTMGAGTKNVFLSEFGHGNQMDLLELARLCEQYGSAAEGVDAKLFHSLLDRFEADAKRWGVDQIYPTLSDLVTEAEEIGAQMRREDIDLVRSNPKIAGYSLTAWSDEGYESQGIVTLFREPKHGMFEVFRQGFAPVHWCLFVDPVHVYPGAPMTVEAVLVNEDVLKPGDYPVRLRVLGPNGLVCEKNRTLTIPAPTAQGEPPLALPAFKEQITLDGGPGAYQVSVFFDRGAAARANRTVYLGDREGLPKATGRIAVWAQGNILTPWLAAHGAQPYVFDPAQAPSQREVIMLQGAGPLGDAAAYQALFTRVAQGATVIVLTPNVLVDPKRQARRGLRELDFLPGDDKVRIGNPPGGWEGHDKVLKRHPVFAGLPNGCLMDVTFYRDLISPDWFVLPPSIDAKAEVIAPCFIVKGNYSAGAVMLSIPIGEGRCFLSAFRLVELLGKHPAADRMVLNLLAYAAKSGK